MLEMHWIEDKELDGANANTLRKYYVAMKNNKGVRGDFDMNMFFCASPEAAESVLSPEVDHMPTAESPSWRDEAPFLLAVMEEESVNPHGEEESCDPVDPHHEANWYKPVFKMPIEIIADELWMIIRRGILGPTRITRNVRGSTELGGELPRIVLVDEPYELWWGAGPTPRSVKRRRILRERRN